MISFKISETVAILYCAINMTISPHGGWRGIYEATSPLDSSTEMHLNFGRYGEVSGIKSQKMMVNT